VRIVIGIGEVFLDMVTERDAERRASGREGREEGGEKDG
jgi:hypothetical protein